RARPGPKLAGRDPGGLALRCLLVEVRLAVDPVRIPLQGEGPLAQMRHDHVSDLGVVLRKVALRHTVAGEQDALGMRQPDGAVSDLDLLGRHQAQMMLISGKVEPMSVVSVDRATGVLVVEDRKLFPIVLSNGPPLGAKAPSGQDALAELAAGGANFIRAGRSIWSLESVDEQIAAEQQVLDAAAAQGLHCWLQLGNVPDLPAGAFAAKEQLLTRIVGQLKDHPALGAWKGVDEPANPNRPARVPAAGLVRAYRTLRQTDPDHPVVITQAPVSTLAQLVPYRPAFDITRAHIYPVPY